MEDKATICATYQMKSNKEIANKWFAAQALRWVVERNNSRVNLKTDI